MVAAGRRRWRPVRARKVAPEEKGARPALRVVGSWPGPGDPLGLVAGGGVDDGAADLVGRYA